MISQSFITNPRMDTVHRKTLLYRSRVEYADFCINHVEGCAHGCRFPCYAMMMKKRSGSIGSYKEWLRPKLVGNALELLDRELPKYRNKIRFVHLCFSTDPFMYGYPEVSELTLRIIQKLNSADIKCVILSKGIYPRALADRSLYSIDNEYGITLVSLDEDFKQRFEPYSAPYHERVKSLEYLHKRGLKTWVSMEPYPTPNLVNQNVEPILKRASFVDKLVFGRLNYNVESTRFRGNSRFYQECVRRVLDFCDDNRIESHIKRGTCTQGHRGRDRLLPRSRSFSGEERRKQASLF